MTHCLDTDTLVGIGNAVEWNESSWLHVAECATCQTQIRQLAAIHGVLDGEFKPRPGFVDEVVSGVREAEAQRRARRRTLGILDFLNPALAGVTALLAMGFVAGGPSALELGPPILIAPAIAAAVTLWWNHTHRPLAAS